MSVSANPELQRLLATLSGYNSSSQNDAGHDRTIQSVNGTSTHLGSQINHKFIPGLGSLPPDPTVNPISNPSTPTPQATTKLGTSQTPDPRLSRTATPLSISRTQTPNSSTPEASTITTWPAALKHITKYLANDEKVSTRIRHLISEQHKHERQWSEGRESLINLHNGRSGISVQVSALLKSLNGKDVDPVSTDPEANKRELAAYDAKVYKGLLSMSADFDRQLRGLGIPFFAIKHELVILEEGQQKPTSVKHRLDKGELRELQKRTLQHLEDLFGD